MKLENTIMKIILSIAGSDSGGGAGIQADIKTISALGGFATTAITATTAQNTLGVSGVHPLPAAHVRAQIDAVLSDIGTDAIKIGMLHNAEIIEAVAKSLIDISCPIILDPVMVASSGDALLDDTALDALTTQLFPLATLITPNLPEAERLLRDKTLDIPSQITDIAAALYQHYHTPILLKGGHAENQDTVSDLLYLSEKEQYHFEQTRIETRNTHGTGCTLSSAIATFLAQGEALPAACEKAQTYVHRAIAAAPNLGNTEGHGPLWHGVS